MKIKFGHIALLLSAAAGFAGAGIAPAVAQNANITADQVATILRENPEIVMQAIQAAQAKERDEQAQQLAASAKPIADAVIAGDKQVAFLGNADGQPVVEFFDYNCGFCKRFHSETATPLLAEGGTKLLLVHTPILSEGSSRLAEFAAAANLQGKFAPAHDFLMEHNASSVADANALKAQLIASAGLDEAKFEKALADGSAKSQVEHNSNLSKTAGVAGTPMIYANNQAIPGAIPLGALKQVLAN